MNTFVYPALFHLNENDGSYTVTYPDLPGCISEGKSLENALYMAQDALRQWLECTVEVGQEIPAASRAEDIAHEQGEFVNLIRAELKDDRAVRRTVSIPKWMYDAATGANLSLSRVLQDALKERLNAQ